MLLRNYFSFFRCLKEKILNKFLLYVWRILVYKAELIFSCAASKEIFQYVKLDYNVMMSKVGILNWQ